MSSPLSFPRSLAAVAALVWLSSSPLALGQPSNSTSVIDLATALRLAGAQSIEVKIAEERVREAQAQQDQARLQFFPWIAPSVGYRRHEGNIQDVSGNIIETSKQSYTVGGALNVQLELGDAIYKSLAAKQTTKAAKEGAEARRQETVFDAATGYFELSRAAAAVAVAAEAVRISEDYAAQVGQAVEAGIAFKGDVHRAQLQAEKNRLLLRQAQEQQRLAAARLAQVLSLPSSVELTPGQVELAPVRLVDTNAALNTLVARALASRPELRESGFLEDSSRAERKGATVGPWIPNVGAQAYFGGLGGGRDGDWGNFDDSQDYFVGLTWKVGPGGLFDKGRKEAALSRERTAGFRTERVRQEIERQVVEAHTRAGSLADQVKLARTALDAAEQLLRLSRDRREFGAGVVLETIQAEQDLTRARLEYVTAVAGYNKAQYALRRTIGEIGSVE